ncbi:MAG: hypothetical protein QW597_01810 [Thermoplasmataceae archaeon]
MLTINGIFYLNFLVFGIFAALLCTEIMGAVVLIVWWNKYRKPVLEYIIPIWEITGTFGAFWVVLSDFAFPAIINPLAGLYAAAIMLFLILFVARNASIAFGEYIIKKGWLDERKLYTIYAFVTLLIGIVVLYILSGVIGGYGVNMTDLNVNLAAWFSHPADILFILGAVIILLGLAPVFFGVRELANMSLLFTTVGVVISAITVYLFEGSGISLMVIIPIILTLAPAILFRYGQLVQFLTNKLFFIIWLTVDLFFLNFMVYPRAFGQSLAVDSLTTSGPMVYAYFIITLIGGIILAVLIALFSVAVSRKRKMQNTSS